MKSSASVRCVCLDAVESLFPLQFTLYSVLKGNKPDFHLAMAPDRAPQFYQSFVERLRKEYDAEKVKGAVMFHEKYMPFGNDSCSDLHMT